MGEDSRVFWGLGAASVCRFCPESLILSQSGQVWGKENAELLGRRVLQGRVF